MHRRVLVLLLLIAGFTAARAQDWPLATPESQGMDSAALAALVDYGGKVSMDSLVVVRNGRLVAEAYYAPYRAPMKHRVNSATKAVIGMLTGIAIARGEMPPPSASLAELFPRAANATDPRWKEITLQHLLDMTSGIAWTEPLSDAIPLTAVEMERSRNWEDFILARAIAQSPGASFDYNSGNPHLLSIALARRTGMPTEAYARKVLFEPLGITDLRWRKDPQGVAIGGYGLYLQTRDMARLGQLYLQHGAWNGRQVVPRAWTDRAFAAGVDMRIPGLRYADFWWSVPQRGATMMVGFNRQVVLVLPDLQVVAAMTGRANYPLEDMIAHVRRAARSAEALPEDPLAQAALREKIRLAAVAPPPGIAGDTKASALRAAYRLDDNPMGVREIGFDFTVAPPMYRMLMRSRDLVAPVGLAGEFAEGDDGGTPIFTRAAWQDARTLHVEQRWPEEGTSVRYVLKFDGDDLEIARTNERGVRSVVKARRAAAE
ncbi:serine hydrolase domain-containing protein [Ramlibacter sp. AN1133]|uniref:serine hydrolase domain-containing protein n=1 Tax=Ramlibacter sp. AN1133 TaxID=3133429 RepID=UPI0030BBA513